MADLVLQKKTSSWISYIHKRVHKENKNFIAFTSGPTGVGKSMADLYILEQVDPTFHIGRVVFSPKELMTVINSEEMKKGKGKAIMFEEAGVGISNRDWYTQTNKMLNFLVQTFRHRNFVLIMNAPYMDFIDKATRKLFHAEFQMVGIDFKTKTSRIKAQLIQYNGRYQKWYYKFLRVITPDGIVPITIWTVKLPSDKLSEEYEKKKREFTDALNLEISKSFSEKEGKAEKNKVICDKCSYTWETKKDNPPSCAKCRSKKTRLVKDAIENNNNVESEHA